MRDNGEYWVIRNHNILHKHNMYLSKIDLKFNMKTNNNIEL